MGDNESLEIEDVVVWNGWTASRADLLERFSRYAVEQALAEGRIERVARGRYGLPATIGPARAAADRVNGVVSHRSAALYWGLPMRARPGRPAVTVPRGRKLARGRRAGVRVRWADLPPEDVRGRVTTPVRTALDCASTCPLPDALVVLDGALRRKLVSRAELEEGLMRLSKHARARARRAVELADPRPQSPFESLVRGCAADVPGLLLVPQVQVGNVHPDLYDERLRLAVECDSFEFHARREDLVKDCQRYNDFALADVGLVRFAWEHAMFRPSYIRETLASAAEVRQKMLEALGGRWF